MTTWRKVCCCLVAAVVAGTSLTASAYEDKYVTCDADGVERLSVTDESVSPNELVVYTITNTAATSLTLKQGLRLLYATVVGGGGAGGNTMGGGGGAGGVIVTNLNEQFASGSAFAVSIGLGGVPGTGQLGGGNGGDTTLGYGGTEVTGKGGGGGDGWSGASSSGGSGGGGSNGRDGSAGTEGQGYAGAKSGGNSASGGGGGAGGPGELAASGRAGKGGDGVVNTFTGVCFGGGGGGGGSANSFGTYSGGFGGAGGGGNGGKGEVGGNGVDGLGGGGGGGGWSGSMPGYAGGRGGSGAIVLVFEDEAFQVAAIQPQTFTGAAICPQPEVLVKGASGFVPGVLGDDYTLEYEDNFLPGTGRVIVLGRGALDGKRASASFAILAPTGTGISLDGDFSRMVIVTGWKIWLDGFVLRDDAGNLLAADTYEVSITNTETTGTATVWAKVTSGPLAGALAVRNLPLVILPAEYVPVEWVGSTGDQWVDTGVVPVKERTGIDIRFGQAQKLDNQAIFAQQWSWSNGYLFWLHAGGFKFDNYRDVPGYAVGRDYHVTIAPGGRVTMDYGAGETTYTGFNNGTCAGKTLGLFAPNGGGSNRASYRLYSFTMTDDGVTVCDLVPVRRVSDGKPGFYDVAASDPATAFRVNMRTGADLQCGDNKVGFRLGALPCQPLGATPVPQVFDDAGNEIAASNFTFSYAGNDAAGTATVTATGKSDSDYVGRSAIGTFTVSARAEPDTFTWAGNVSGNFEDDAKWTLASGGTGHPEIAGDIVILPKFMSDDSYTVTVNAPFGIGALTVGDVGGVAGNCKVTMVFRTGEAASRVAGNLVVKPSGTITHYGPADTQKDSLVLQVGGDCTVEADGFIHADGKGHNSNKGPGSAAMLNGASHAGQGKGASGGPYGSVLHPVKWGSATSGAQGGGAVHLDVGGTLTVNGRVSANGAPDNTHYTSCGGSLWIECGALAGSGRVEARDGQTNGRTANYTSSGGRLAVYQRTATDFTSFPVTQMATVQYGLNAAGTIYLESAGGRRDLHVIGGTQDAPQKTPFPMPDDGDDLTQYADLNVHVSGYAHLSVCDLKMPAMTLPIRSIEVVNKAMMTIGAGSVLQVSGDVDMTGAKAASVAREGWLEFVGGDAVSFRGAAAIGALGGIVCTNAGKVIRFGTAAADKLTIGLGVGIVMKGDEESPVQLLSETDGTPWSLSLNANPSVATFEHVALKDSDASTGAPALAISSQNLGNNTNWGFSNPIVPGETITWTGALSAKWDAAENWNPSRAPVETDCIAIPAVAANYPTLPSGTYLFNAIEIAAGAALTLNGCTLTVTNDLSCAGGLVFTDDEDLYLSGDATFAADSITVNSARIHLIGGDEQAIDFCETALHNVYVEKDGGGVTFTAHGFSADSFTCAASAAQYLAFAAGQAFTLPTVSLSSIGADRQLTLRSDASGTAWKLVTTESGQNISGVEVHDSDASDGALVLAGTKSVATDNCTNWDTVTSIASWLGGSGNWTDPAKWSTGEVPGANESVSIVAAENETLTVTIPANSPAAVGALTVKGATGGTATLVANSPVTVVRNCEIWEGGVVELNCYDSAGDAPNTVTNNLRVRAGGVLSHTKGTSNTQDKMLHLRVLGDVQVDEGGKISATGKGFPKEKGPGYGSGNCVGASFASYAYNNGNRPPYGSILRPVSWGSSLGRNYNAGGAVHLVVDGALEVNGSVEADGASCVGDVYTVCGGSVWIECAELTGSGLVTARESAYNGRNLIDTKGSGGRIAVYQRAATDFTAFPKERILTHRNSWNQPGTVYLESADTSNGADLYVMAVSDNASLKTPFPMPDDGSDYSIYSNVNVHVGSASILSVGNLTGAARYQIRTLDVASGGKVEVVSGATLGIRLGVSVDSKSSVDVLGNALELVGGEAAALEGFSRVSNIGSLICTNAGKVVSIGTGANDVIGLGAGANLVLQGEEGNPVTLLPLDGAASWQLDANANANLSVKYVAASNSTALTQAVLAMESVDLGGNVKWSFISEIKPDAPIHWTGANSTDWGDTENWDEKRTPILTDKVYIDAVGEDGNTPVLANGVFTQLKLYVASGAKLTLSDATLVVSNEFTMAGELVFEGAEELHLTGHADFTGGSVSPKNGVVRLLGDDSQIVDFGGVSLRYLNIAKPGGVVVMNGDLTAAILRCDAASPLDIQFDDGVTFDIADLYLNGGEKNLTLKGIEAGDGWNLKATADSQCVTGVKVSGCTATGARIYAGQNSSDDGGNVNWDFASETAVWLGGSGDWTDSTHWSLGAVPSAGTQVMLNVGEGGDVTITVPKANAVSVASLSVRAADGGTAKIVANSPLAVAGDVDVGLNSTLELNCYDDDGEAPNVVSGDVRVRNGGRITHAGSADAENAKVHLGVGGDVTVEEGGSIDANAKGYSKAKGPGSTGTMCQGAAHAGKGHNNGAQPYGSVFCPTNWGSGNSGCCGGGAVHLVVAGELRVDGRISADSGVNGVYVGAGGSVWVECARLVGGGSMSVAEGTRPADTANRNDCTSSGGRIAVYQTAAKDFSAFPRTQMYTSWLGSNAAGTIYLECVNRPGELFVDLGTRAVYDSTQRTALALPDEAELAKFRSVNVTIHGTASATLYGDVTIRDLVLEASDAAGKKVPCLELGGHTLKIRSMRHVNGRKWFKSYEAALESGHVVLGGTALNPGRIEWIGGADGTVLMVR